MLPKSSRISRALFSVLLKSGKYFNSEHFLLRVAPLAEIRVSASVSKKVSKQAVVRNKIRRRIYSFMREVLPDIKPSLYLIVAKPGAYAIKGDELRSELVRLIRPIRS